jgi:hypothetical protein
VFALMVIQFILGVSGAGTSPILGGLHAVNALLIAATTYLLIKTHDTQPRHTHPPPYSRDMIIPSPQGRLAVFARRTQPSCRIPPKEDDPCPARRIPRGYGDSSISGGIKGGA